MIATEYMIFSLTSLVLAIILIWITLNKIIEKKNFKDYFPFLLFSIIHCYLSSIILNKFFAISAVDLYDPMKFIIFVLIILNLKRKINDN